MGKGLRSKVKRRFRSQRGQVLDGHSHTQEKEEQRQAVMDKVLTSEKIPVDSAAMDVTEEQDITDMDVDGKSSKSTRSALKQLKARKLERKAKYAPSLKRKLRQKNRKKH